MNFRFRFTAAFVIVSAVILAMAAVLTSRSIQRSEEAELVESITSETNQDSDLLTVAAAAYTGDDLLVGAASDSAISTGFESLVTSTLAQSSNIIRLSLFDAERNLLWSSVADPAVTFPGSDSQFASALQGEIATGLNKNVASTYIPIPGNGDLQVLEVDREVTEVLGARIDASRDSIFRTLYTTLGASFAVLFGVVVTADTVLHRSRRRALEQEHAAAESKAAADQLALRNDQLMQMAEERDRFLSMVSHELRTPLTSMLAFTEVLKRRQEGANRESNLDHLSLMRRNGDHLNSLIEELLEVTQLHGDKFEIVKAEFELQDLIDDIQRSAGAMASIRDQEFKLNCTCNEMVMLADRKRISQAVLNLVRNASQYSPQRTAITLSVECMGDLVKMTVRDEGPGIPEDERNRLFEQFHRGNSEFTRSQSGLGLGLPIVKAIVEAHGGKISLTSQPRAGTVATLLVPVRSSVETDELDSMSGSGEIVA